MKRAGPRSALALALLAGLSAASCRPAPAKAAFGLSEPGLAGTIEMLMGDDLRAARALGAGEPALALTGTGISGDSVGGFVDIPSGTCALILGRGSRGVQDVDVFAFQDDGTVLASDEAPAKEGSLLICPPRASRVFASGRLAAGFGMFGLTVQTLAPEPAIRLGQRFGVVSNRSSQPSELSSSWPGLDERLAEHRRRVGGTWETVRRVALPLDPRAYVSVSALVDARDCVDVYVTPSDEVAHLEVEVLDASGRWIGSAEARGVDRNLMVCSSEPREITIRSRPHAGRGLAALVVSRAVDAGFPGNSARFDIRPEAPLGALRQANETRLEALGYGRASLLRDGILETERRISVGLPLSRGCSRIDVLTAAPLRSLRAWLWDANGQLIAEDLGGIDATLFACGASASARLDLDTASRGGAFAIEVRHSAVTPRAAEKHALAMGRLLRLLDNRGRLPSLARLPEVQLAHLSGTELARISLLVPAGRCVELAAALDRGVSGLEVRLLDVTSSPEEGALEGTELGYGANTATAHLCAVKPARERSVIAELRANVGEGAALWASQTFDPDPDVKGPQAR